MAEVVLDKVTKVFTTFKKREKVNVTAVNHLKLDIRDGEFLVLLGPSGCGKTTTLRIIAGLEIPTEGKVYIGNRDVTKYPAKERGIAMVFQDYALYPHMNVYENMSFGLKNLKFPKEEIKRRVETAARILDIEELFDRKPKGLSGGQRQRVALGRAIVRQPQVYLFDEPLSNLDARLRIQMRAELKELHMNLKTTSIYVTHDQIEAMTLGNRIVILELGTIQQIGTPEEIYNKPSNLFVANFIGTPPMNFFTCGVSRDDDLKFVFENGKKISVPNTLKNKLQDFMNKRITLGIRPENISLEKGKNSVEASVTSSEFLGINVLIHFKVGEERGTIYMNSEKATSIGAGSKIPLLFDPDKIHVFDPETGKNIGLIK
ncbi:MAG: glycerol-3-phosphate ABC transporter ATP-binding protein [Thermotoga sp.]|nr:MAG: glycerol-3-phosphate ABC transporter ATP-binding protein [Thermotoga sp.]